MTGDSFYNGLNQVIKGRVMASEPMSRHTSWRIGGPADFFVEPADSEDLCRALAWARNYGLPVIVIGNGTNLLVSDSGIRGLVIKLGAGLSGIEIKGAAICAGAGALLPRLANRALQAGLAGFEFLAGIPGTVGGALLMNAGANGCSVGERVKMVEAIDYQGHVVTFTKNELKFNYRKSCLSRRNLIITGASFEGMPCPGEEIKKRMDDYLSRRRSTQPLELPNAGSVFKNPPGDSAGRLIENAGCKEMRVGGIQVSPRHANFFVNLGGGTAADVLELVHTVRATVEDKCSVKLLLEVQILGEV
ncbi:MAG TPA: UDP-N-acetylmuramate dehydrogenase [Desulfotomaculum sp.]|nr:UDP-N-acetylmuramate dehydrogenase [Desulfotomaculum sp.]